jgi:hypothetical protein
LAAVAAVFGFVVMSAEPAIAGDRVVPPSNATESFAVSVSGYITPKCTLDTSAGTAANFGDMLDRTTGNADATKTITLPFAMNCNSPFVASLTSKNGGLAFDGHSEPSFATHVDYSATLDMGSIAGAPALSCDSATMRAQSGDDTNPRCRARSDQSITTASGNGALRLQLRAGTLPLLKGNYSDELVLKISPRVSG